MPLTSADDGRGRIVDARVAVVRDTKFLRVRLSLDRWRWVDWDFDGLGMRKADVEPIRTAAITVVFIILLAMKGLDQKSR